MRRWHECRPCGEHSDMQRETTTTTCRAPESDASSTSFAVVGQALAGCSRQDRLAHRIVVSIHHSEPSHKINSLPLRAVESGGLKSETPTLWDALFILHPQQHHRNAPVPTGTAPSTVSRSAGITQSPLPGGCSVRLQSRVASRTHSVTALVPAQLDIKSCISMDACAARKDPGGVSAPLLERVIPPDSRTVHSAFDEGHTMIACWSAGIIAAAVCRAVSNTCAQTRG